MIRVLGIDPGSVVTGYGIIETDGVRTFHLDHGHIRVAGDDLPEKLGFIYYKIAGLVEKWKPDEAGVEQVFMSNNAMSALKLGQARGAAICALVQNGVKVSEYTAKQVKKSVVGHGAASKEQVQHMVGMLLSISGTIQNDAADGLAIAMCHAHSRSTYGIQLPARKRRKSRWK